MGQIGHGEAEEVGPRPRDKCNKCVVFVWSEGNDICGFISFFFGHRLDNCSGNVDVIVPTNKQANRPAVVAAVVAVAVAVFVFVVFVAFVFVAFVVVAFVVVAFVAFVVVAFVMLLLLRWWLMLLCTFVA